MSEEAQAEGIVGVPVPERDAGTLAAVARIGGVSYLSLCIGLVRGILYTRALVPTSRGIVQLVFLIANYLAYGPLAIYFSLEKRLPILLGEGKHEEAERLERAGVTAVYGLSILAAVLMWAYAAVARGSSEIIRVSIVSGGFYLIFGQVGSIYRVVLRSHLRFGLIAASILFEAVVLCVLIVGGAYLLDAPGTMTGWAVGAGLLCLYFVAKGSPPTFTRIDRPMAAQLMRTGLPLLAVSLTGTFLRTADNIVVAKCLGLEALGYYSLAWQLAAYLYNLAGSADAVLTPKIFRAHGRGELDGVRGLVMQATSAYAAFMPPLAGIGALASAILLRTVLPRYLPAIPPLQVFFFTVTFLALPMAARTVFVAMNREFELMAWDGLGGLVIAGGVYYLIHNNPHVSLVHIGLMGGVGLFVGGYTVTLRGLALLRVPTWDIVRHALGLSLPLAYCVASLWAARHFAMQFVPSRSPFAGDLLALALFALLVAPLVWWSERRMGVFTRLLRDRRRRAG